MAGRRSEGRREPEPWEGESRGARTDEERLTNLFGGKGEGDRLPIMGAVEPSWENAMEPFDTDIEGDKGPGLEFLLEGCELDILERRLIHEGRRFGTWFVGSIGSTMVSMMGSSCGV